MGGCLIPVEEGHVAVHQDETVPERVVRFNAFFDDLYSLFAVESKRCSFLSISEIEDQQEPINDITVELLVIYHQDLS